MDAPVWEATFLAALEHGGCVARAATAAGVTARGAYKRRASCPTFAAAWSAALRVYRLKRSTELLADELAARSRPVGDHRSGRVERPGPRLSEADVERFLATLAATANVRVAARAAGASAQGMYRRRLRDSVFAEAWDAAIELGRERIDAFLVEAACASFDPGTAAVPEGLPDVTVDQALQILAIGRKRKSNAPPTWAERQRSLDDVRERILWKLDNIDRHAARAAGQEVDPEA